MGSCFRWKKKNSYTVTHDEEYSISGGKYNPHREPFVVKKNAELPAAKKWAAESKDRAEANQNVPDTNSGAGVHVSSDLKEGKASEKEAVRENGFHSRQRDDSHSDRSSSSSVGKEDQVKSEVESAEHYEREKVDVSPERQEQVDDVGGGEEKVDVEVTSGGRPDSPTTDHATMESMAEPPAYEVQVEAVSSMESRSAAVHVDDDSDKEDDDREDPVRAREEYLQQRHIEEAAAAVASGGEESAQYRHQSDSEVVNEIGEVRMTDSPAGTWDARLNKDVRAEIEEHQRSSLANSKSNSEASLDPGDRRDVYPEASVDQEADLDLRYQRDTVPETSQDRSYQEDVVPDVSQDRSYQEDVGPDVSQDRSYQEDVGSEASLKDTDPKDDHGAVVQRVQFDLSNEQNHDDEDANVTKVNDDVIYVVDREESTIRYEGTETYTLADGSRQQEELDNDLNSHLDTTSSAEQQYEVDGAALYLAGDRKDFDEGVIQLSDEVAVSYEEPYSSSGQVTIAVHDSSP